MRDKFLIPEFVVANLFLPGNEKVDWTPTFLKVRFETHLARFYLNWASY